MGQHLIRLPSGTSTLIPSYRTAPMGAVSIFWPHFPSNYQECQWEAPFYFTPHPLPFNIYSCNRSEKSKRTSQGNPRARGVMVCMPDGSHTHSPPPAHPLSHPYRQNLATAFWLNKCKWIKKIKPLGVIIRSDSNSVSDLALKTQRALQ